MLKFSEFLSEAHEPSQHHDELKAAGYKKTATNSGSGKDTRIRHTYTHEGKYDSDRHVKIKEFAHKHGYTENRTSATTGKNKSVHTGVMSRPIDRYHNPETGQEINVRPGSSGGHIIQHKK